MNFGDVLAIAKYTKGAQIARKGWNGKGMYVFKAYANDLTNCLSNGEFKCNDSLCLKTAQNTITIGWVPSQSDLFAEDWEVV
jgi:hypothetical protein